MLALMFWQAFASVAEREALRREQLDGLTRQLANTVEFGLALKAQAVRSTLRWSLDPTLPLAPNLLLSLKDFFPGLQQVRWLPANATLRAARLGDSPDAAFIQQLIARAGHADFRYGYHAQTTAAPLYVLLAGDPQLQDGWWVLTSAPPARTPVAIDPGAVGPRLASGRSCPGHLAVPRWRGAGRGGRRRGAPGAGLQRLAGGGRPFRRGHGRHAAGRLLWPPGAVQPVRCGDRHPALPAAARRAGPAGPHPGLAPRPAPGRHRAQRYRGSRLHDPGRRSPGPCQRHRRPPAGHCRR